MRVAVDSSVLVALINPRDLWRQNAVALRAREAELVYFDCVAAEAISAATRRLHEKSRLADVGRLLDRLNGQVPAEAITWILPDVPGSVPRGPQSHSFLLG